jgi:hypothetical protein
MPYILGRRGKVKTKIIEILISPFIMGYLIVDLEINLITNPYYLLITCLF